jgi:hypothetical protein
MKKNNAIALIGYIAIIAAPIMGITGLIMAVVLVCNKARIRQALGIIVVGFIADYLFRWIFTPDHVVESLIYCFVLIGIPSAIIYCFTKE